MEEYRERHAAVWPEMREALTAMGWRNYSLFLSPAGTVIGYVETDDFEAARRAMEQTGVNARWQAEMAEFFVGLEGRRPDERLLAARRDLSPRLTTPSRTRSALDFRKMNFRRLLDLNRK
jgi:L-rhamnose mutarotase